jgi:hypothetical protein
MNNKPVAWTDGRGNYFDEYSFFPVNDLTPLYTHPVKELTDEEIYACFHQYFVLGEPKPTHYELEHEDLIDFAKAILRKAQEK